MERQIVFKVKGMNYPIEFPNVGKFRKIEAMKQIISNGMYGQILSTGTLSSNEAADMIDIEAYFIVLCPKLMEDLAPKSFEEMDIEDFGELKTAYQEQFIPWWNSILRILKPES